MVDASALRRYVEKCAKQSAKAEHVPNDVEYEYRIIDEYILFACRSEYGKSIRRFLYRLLFNLPRNFGLYLNVVIPDPRGLGDAYRIDAPFYLAKYGVDPNYSVLEWTVFGEPRVVCAETGNCRDRGTPHLEKLKKYGYDCQGPSHDDWYLFKAAYEQAYGITPFEGYAACIGNTR